MAGLARRSTLLLVAAAIFAGVVPFAPSPLYQAMAAMLAGVLLLIAVWVWSVSRFKAARARRRLSDVMAFVEHDSAPAFCTDAQGAVVVQNRAATERFGGADGDVLSRVFEPIFANPDAVVHRLRDAVRREGGAREDVVTRRGHVRVSVNAIPGGELWRLEDMVDRPARTGDGIGLPMLTVSASGTILYMNETLRRAVGRRAKRLEDVFDDLPLRDGGIHTLRAAEGAASVRVAVSRPVSDRKEIFLLPVEAGAEEVDSPGIEALLDTLPIALIHIDESGHVTSLNRVALKLLPRAAEGGMPLAALVEGLGRSVTEWVAEGAEGRGLYRPEVVRVTGAGEVYLQITLGRPIRPEDRGLIAFLNDATELKSIEAQFVQSQKMQAIGQLAGGVAHDFNNLLTAITGHCDLLLLRRSDDDPDFADLSQINQNANRAAALVGQLLAFSRKQTLKMQQLDLRDTLGDMTHLLNRLLGERVRLVVSHDPALIPIRGDRRQLEQVVMNLVVNARDAMPEGGEVRISTVCRYLEQGLSRDQVKVPPGQYVVVSVSDQGRGIEPEKIGRIFEPFFTTKRPGEGTGLGLSMAYGIVKQSGGYIFADSTPGEGATFSLYFPAGRDAAEADPAADEADTELVDAVSIGAAAEVHDAEILPAEQVASVSGTEPGRTASRDDAAVIDLARHGAGMTDADDRSAGSDGSAVDPAAKEGFSLDDPIEESDEDLTLAALNRISASDGPNGPASGDIATPAGEKTVPGEGESGDVLAEILQAQPEVFDMSENDENDHQSDKGDGSEPTDGEAPVGAREASGTPAGPDADKAGQEAPALRVVEGGAAQADEAASCTVLLVEDEAPVRAFASRALRLKGYNVVEAACAEDALAMLDDASLDIDLFVTDVMMPGLDGPTWVRRALERRPDVRTIFVSGYTQDTMSETSVPVPNSYFLPKPFSLADLTRTVHRAVGDREAS